jgi:basic amino acid/polyamine antiporter, APA family
MAQEPHASQTGPRRTVSVLQAIAVTVGIVIGAGIFKSPAWVAGNLGSAELIYLAWALGGVLSIIGALCYAELASAFPDAGGDYHFLGRAYGPRIAYLFAWTRFAVINSGAIALLAFVFGDYMQSILPIGAAEGSLGSALYALGVLALLTALNLRSNAATATTQVGLTGLEVAGLLVLVTAGAAIAFGFSPSPGAQATAAPASLGPGFGLAMVFVLLAFGGWSEAATLSAEVKGGPRGIVLALVGGLSVITLLYLAVNWAYLTGLGHAGLAGANAVAADLMRQAFGPIGAVIIAAVIAIATLTSINATIIIGCRTTYAAARDWGGLGALGVWDEARGLPRAAVWAQCGFAILLVGVGAIARDGFAAMVEYTAPAFWFFMALSALSLIVLRVREPNAPRPFKTPLYPLTPLIFAGSSGYLLWSSLTYAADTHALEKPGVWAGLAVLAIGVVLVALKRLKPASVPL